MRTASRLGALIAGLAAASVALTGCLYGLIPGSAATPAPSRTPATQGVAAELLPFYGQPLTWTSCEGVDAGTYDCTTVRAPLDWENPDAGDIDLALIRRHADSGAPVGSLLTNPGGPGASGVDLVEESATFAAGADVIAAYDLIGFDPRGVGQSTAVRCYDAADMDAYLFDIPPSRRGTPQWEDELLASDRAFGEACEENSEGILPFITTVSAARDLDLLRAVLGDEKLNYLGYSYGTFLGATYAKLYPQNVGRVVFDGAVDPSVSGLDVGVTQGVGFESALRAYMADCLAGQECPFRGSVDDGMADLGTLLESVDADPLPASDGRMLGADSLMTAIVAALYNQGSWPYLSTALADVAEGGADIAFQLADFYYAREGGQYADNSTEAFTAYNCMDYPADTTAADEEAAKDVLAAQAPTIAPYWLGPDGCAVWPYPPTGVRERITAEGAGPIVVVGTTNDPATPYEWAVSLADQLSSGVLVTRVGEGHTGYNKGNECVDAAVEAYFLSGTVPEDGLRCE